MLVLLPLISGVLLFLMFSETSCWRSSLLSAALVMGVLVAFLTEILSAFRLLGLIGVAGAWALVSLALGFIYFKKYKKKKIASLNSLIQQIKFLPKKPLALLSLLGLGFIVAAVGLTAVVAAPNTWDSMTYHMSRVAHWIQNASVAHYPTYYLPQLFHPPLAEFAILHLQVLIGGDRLANLVQWFSMVGSIVGVSLIAKQLGANWHGQVFAAVFCATIPMGILQGSSTQNDYVVTFWLVCFASYVLQTVKSGINLKRLLGLGASLGLAILTKTSAYFWAFPFCLWLLFWGIKKIGRQVWKPILLVAIVVIGLNLSHSLRNFELFSTLLGAPADYQQEYKIEVLSLPTFVSNILKNLALHLDIVRNLSLQSVITPTTGIAEKLISIIHSGLGVDVNDPRTTWPPNSFQVPGLSFDENTAGNPLHLLILLLSIVFFTKIPVLHKNKHIALYMLSLVGGFIMLCLLLKWQPYQSRHHLYFFVLFSGFVGTVFSSIVNKRVIYYFAIFLIVISMPWVVNNKFRPMKGSDSIFMLSRIDGYFSNRIWLKEPYTGATNFLQSVDCGVVGLSLEEAPFTSTSVPWEYPLWVLSSENGSKFEHVNIKNASAAKSIVEPHANFTPCAIIAFEPKQSSLKERQEIVTEKGTYLRKWSADPLTVYLSR